MKRIEVILIAILALVLIPVSAFSCEEWTLQDSVPTEANLWGIWGSSPQDVYAVGDSGTILHYDGSHWSIMDSGTTKRLYSIWGSSSTDIFAAGDNIILHFDGTTWSQMDSGTISVLFRGIWGTSPTDVFVVGAVYIEFAYNTFRRPIILHYDGHSWSRMMIPLGIHPEMGILFAIWGSSRGDIFAIGGFPEIFHYNGRWWSATPREEPWETIMGIWGSSPADVFAVGSHGIIVYYNGIVWDIKYHMGAFYLNAIWGSSHSDVYAVGDVGTILHYNGIGWSYMESGTTQWLTGIWGSSGDDVYAVGFGGTILHCE